MSQKELVTQSLSVAAQIFNNSGNEIVRGLVNDLLGILSTDNSNTEGIKSILQRIRNEEHLVKDADGETKPGC